MKGSAVSIALALGVAGCASTPTAMVEPPPLADLRIPGSGVYTSGRIAQADVERLAASGFRHVVDLTLDAETPGYDEAASVRAEGMAYEHLPIRGAEDLTFARVREFDRVLRAAARPVLVHCASGNRVGALAALRAGWIEGMDAEAAIDEGRRWGLKGLEPAVRERLAHGVPR